MGMMGFWFSPGSNCVLFLFSSWGLDTAVKYAFGILGAFAMGVCFEVCRMQFPSRFLNVFSKALMFGRRKLILKGLSLVSSLLYGVQMFFAYAMMLLVMTYEVG
jgi:copper transporter 1